jgi:peptidyl-prolyl cis-trans isomerase C
MRTMLMLSLTLLVASCTSSGSGERTITYSDDSGVVETINGEAVSQTLLDAMARGRGMDLSKADQREQAIKELTEYVLLGQEARRAKYDGSAQYRADVEVARLQGIANAAVLHMQKLSPVGDDLLKSEYEQQVARAGKTTYDFSQLLFDNEADALKAADDALSAKTFASVYDKWKDKAKQARVFNQVPLNRIPESLGKVIAELAPGQTTKVPVKTEFGWHLINVSATKPFVAPSFESVRDGIRRNLQDQLLQQRMDALRAQAKIVVTGEAAGEKPKAN